MEQIKVKDQGSFLVSGILEEFILHTTDRVPSENSPVDFLTLKISGRQVHVYPFREILLMKNIPPVIQPGKRYSIIMKVRRYGNYYFAFDFDFYLAMLQEIKQ
jgi:hypothetical protein